MAQLLNTPLSGSANLKAYYRFEADGTDSTANAFNLTLAGTPAFAAAKYGNGMNLGTSNSTKKASIVNNLSITGGNCSLVGWVNINTALGSGINYDLFYQSSTTNNVTNRISYQNTAGTKQLHFLRDTLGAGGADITYTVDLGTGVWFHLAYTFDGSTILGYVNGVQQASGAASGSGVAGGTDGFFVGVNSSGTTNYASTFFDDVAVFNSVLTPAQIVNLSQGGSSMFFNFF